MINLIGFEIKKFCNRKKNLIVIILFAILSVIFITLNFNLEGQLKKSEILSIDLEIKSLEDALTNVENEIIRLPENEKLKKINTMYLEDLRLLKSKRVAYASEDFNTYLQCKIQADKNLISNVENGNIILGQNIDEVKQNIEINTLLLEKDIEPIYTAASMEGFNFIKLFLNNPISIIIVILIITLSADVVSSEFDSNTYKLLFTQPVSKKKILLSKIISILVMVNLIVLGIISICFFVLGAIKGFGSINYPIQIYNNNIIEYISIGKFLLFELILLILITTFICVLAITISSFSKSTTNSIAISIIVTVSAYMLSNKGFFSNIAHLNPFIYFDISNILQGDLAKLHDNSNINLKFGVLTIGLSTIILLIISINFFGKNKPKFKLFITRK